MQIGEQIRKYRKLLGLTQQDLADKTGISLMSIRRYESGEREPKAITLSVIAQALGVNIRVLFPEFSGYVDSEGRLQIDNDLTIKITDEELESIDPKSKRLAKFLALHTEFVSFFYHIGFSVRLDNDNVLWVQDNRDKTLAEYEISINDLENLPYEAKSFIRHKITGSWDIDEHYVVYELDAVESPDPTDD